MKQLIRDRKVMFSSGPRPSQLLRESVQEAQKEYESGEYVVCKDIEELKKQLNS